MDWVVSSIECWMLEKSASESTATLAESILLDFEEPGRDFLNKLGLRWKQSIDLLPAFCRGGASEEKKEWQTESVNC